MEIQTSSARQVASYSVSNNSGDSSTEETCCFLGWIYTILRWIGWVLTFGYCCNDPPSNVTRPLPSVLPAEPTPSVQAIIVSHTEEVSLSNPPLQAISLAVARVEPSGA